MKLFSKCFGCCHSNNVVAPKKIEVKPKAGGSEFVGLPVRVTEISYADRAHIATPGEPFGATIRSLAPLHRSNAANLSFSRNFAGGLLDGPSFS